jgi:hypothetical protein
MTGELAGNVSSGSAGVVAFAAKFTGEGKITISASGDHLTYTKASK